MERTRSSTTSPPAYARANSKLVMAFLAGALLILASASQAQTQASSCAMFKGPTAIVCHDRNVAAAAFDRYGFDLTALSQAHMRDYLGKFGCVPVDTDAANRMHWSSEQRYDHRTVRASGYITVGFVRKLPADPHVAAWAVAVPYLNPSCRTP